MKSFILCPVSIRARPDRIPVCFGLHQEDVCAVVPEHVRQYRICQTQCMSVSHAVGVAGKYNCSVCVFTCCVTRICTRTAVCFSPQNISRCIRFHHENVEVSLAEADRGSAEQIISILEFCNACAFIPMQFSAR